VPLTLVVALLATACSGDKKKTETPQTAPVANTAVTLKMGKIDVQSFGPDVKVPKGVQKQALTLAQHYVDSAITQPMSSGAVGGRFASLFDTGVRAAATGADQDALTDATVGKVDEYAETSTPVALSALADGSGAFLYLATNFTLKTTAKTAEGSVKSTRNVELTLSPKGNNWIVSAYRVKTVRKLPSGATTTTTAATGTTAP
jgi:hypothetical protein